MSEGSVHLQRHIEILVAQRYVGAERCLWRSLSADASVATVAEVDGAVAVEVFYPILHCALLVLVESGAMRQIEHTQGLSYYLVEHMVVVTAVLTGSIYGANSCDVGSRHIHAVVFAGERQQLILLEREVHAHVQVYILCLHRSNRETDLKTLVRHSADVCQQLVVGKRRHGHIVGIEHVGGLRVIVFGGKHKAVVPQSDLATDIERRLCLPFQVGVVVAYGAERHGRRVVDGYDARLLHVVHCSIGRYAAQIARTSVTRAQFQCAYSVATA